MDTTPTAPILALFRQLPLFSELPESATRQLAERCIVRSVGAGHVLFVTGDECRGLYIIESGQVRIYRTDPEGREQVLHVEGPGRSVAELPLFDGGVYPASAVTTEASRLVFLPRGDFEHLYRSQPDVAQAIVRALGRRLRHLVRLAETLAFRDVAARLALLFVGYAERSGTSTPAGIVLVLDRTQEQLALEIGAARESVSRAMKQLRRKGLIDLVDRNHLLIPDLSRLRALLPAGGEQTR
ncbi:MAG TPA: Crp/Fnr family transcriptional regulator [Gemmatimonadaceae bacterium]|nr:Crp/Fnr family transcriptional regulator [Gemmatimonadaceae bacterium]